MIAKKTWREVFWMAVAYFFLLEVLLVSAVAWWPTLYEELRRSKSLKNLMPMDIFKKMIEEMSSQVQEAGYLHYLATQQFFKGANIVGIACAVLIGTGMIAKERENGTLEFLLSRPTSRGRILWSKYWVLCLVVSVPIFLSSLSAIPLSWTVDNDVGLLPLLHASFHSSLFCIAFLTLTMYFSVLLKAQVHVAFMVGGVIVLEVGIYFVKVLRDGSIFQLSDYATYGPILAGNGNFSRLFFAQELWILGGIAVLYALAHRAFVKMDV